ncbi:MAG: ABC transporter ATP-binding protein [Candidatus Micrarchaeota archaeon]|nr:ABC transporter ATP-binding protein [Candidatus Micrarchaeota archaeon]
MEAVGLSKISFSYPGSRQILRDVSLRIKKGEFAGIIGNVGCGKTTLLMCMNGTIPNVVKGEFSGESRLFGEKLEGRPPAEVWGSAGLVFQNPDDQIFAPTLDEEVAFGLRNAKLSESEVKIRVASALEFAGLSNLASADPCNLSQGQKQKLCIASVVAMGPKLILLDEPSSSLDNKSAEEVYALLDSLNKKGTTIIVVEHDTERLAKYARRIIVIENGGIALDGGREVLASPKIEKMGLKVPCSVKFSRKLGRKIAYSPEEFGVGKK